MFSGDGGAVGGYWWGCGNCLAWGGVCVVEDLVSFFAVWGMLFLVDVV